jgi:spore coat polysaccharide biosynthesis protein SpsF
MSQFRTEQESFWAGAFGSEYVARNRSEQLVAGKTALWSTVLRRAHRPASAAELGANIGLNLVALRRLFPDMRLAGVEINADAHAELARIPGIEASHGSLLSWSPSAPADLAFTAGVLIHLDPAVLPEAYDRLVAASRRYIAVVEYYNPSPTEIPYRGHGGRLFKRDFAGELMDRHPGVAVVDYGFCWRRDPNWPLDDLTWFLLEKR